MQAGLGDVACWARHTTNTTDVQQAAAAAEEHCLAHCDAHLAQLVAYQFCALHWHTYAQGIRGITWQAAHLEHVEAHLAHFVLHAHGPTQLLNLRHKAVKAGRAGEDALLDTG